MVDGCRSLSVSNNVVPRYCPRFLHSLDILQSVATGPIQICTGQYFFEADEQSS